MNLFENQNKINIKQICNIIKKSKSKGFYGFGGDCGAAAIAINKILFDNNGKIIGAFNDAFYECGELIGHVAVKYDDKYFDSDGIPKTIDEIESWAMLDANDPDYIQLADDCWFTLDEQTASETIIKELSQDDLSKMPMENLKKLENILKKFIS